MTYLALWQYYERKARQEQIWVAPMYSSKLLAGVFEPGCPYKKKIEGEVEKV